MALRGREPYHFGLLRGGIPPWRLSAPAARSWRHSLVVGGFLLPRHIDSAQEAARARSLEVLVEITTIAEAGGKKRLTTVLAEFKNGYAKGWAVCVPESFKAALDIQPKPGTLTLTQGKWICFQPGDLIYDNCAPYERRTWAEALKEIDAAFQVTEGCTDILGEVAFEVYKPKRERTALEKVGHQRLPAHKFLKALICGER